MVSKFKCSPGVEGQLGRIFHARGWSGGVLLVVVIVVVVVVVMGSRGICVRIMVVRSWGVGLCMVVVVVRSWGVGLCRVVVVVRSRGVGLSTISESKQLSETGDEFCSHKWLMKCLFSTAQRIEW